MNPLRLSFVQADIVWEDRAKNLAAYEVLLAPLAGESDLVLLPEMFTTGFSMQCRELAEPVEGSTVATLRRWAARYQLALAGSFMAEQDGCYYNRGFFITPQGEATYYDKRHLFRMGEEATHFEAGTEQVVVSYMGWNVCLQICYDLRFPLWSRNNDNRYDLLLYCANWPHSRILAWDTLLAARAIENASYVCGVNRIGTDGTSLRYTGHSAVYSFKGTPLFTAPEGETFVATCVLDKEKLHRFRDKFPVWKDADSFTINNL